MSQEHDLSILTSLARNCDTHKHTKTFRASAKLPEDIAAKTRKLMGISGEQPVYAAFRQHRATADLSYQFSSVIVSCAGKTRDFDDLFHFSIRINSRLDEQLPSAA